MTLQSLIENYGYLAILIGTFLEGETIVILAGFAAQLGYLELPWVIVTAIAGMEALAKNGFRYPFAQYGIQQDVRAGMAVSYPDRK